MLAAISGIAAFIVPRLAGRLGSVVLLELFPARVLLLPVVGGPDERTRYAALFGVVFVGSPLSTLFVARSP